MGRFYDPGVLSRYVAILLSLPMAPLNKGKEAKTMFIQCFITKFDGSDVFVDFEGVRYVFSRNVLGDAVCFVGNGAHQRRLLKMGPAAYDAYPQERIERLQADQMAGAAPVPLGGKQERRVPEADEPLPDGLTVDDALVQGGQVESAPPAETPEEKAQDALNETAAEGVAKAAAADKEAEEPAEVEWHPEAVKTKINEFQGLNKANFKSFVDGNSEQIPGWPKAVRTALAKKLNKNFPGEDPGIEGFVINDYLGNDTGDS